MVEQLGEQAGILDRQGADAKPTFFLRAAHRFPGHETLGTGDTVRGSPEESTTKPVQGHSNPWRELQGTHGKGGERVQHGVEQNDAPSRRQEEHPPPGQILVDLCNERRESREPQFLGGERQAKVRLREALHATLEHTLDLGQQRRRNMHGLQRAFLKVDAKPRRRSKLFEQQPKTTSHGRVRTEDDECVVRILEDGAGGAGAHRRAAPASAARRPRAGTGTVTADPPAGANA
jgi:hypothetical protein